MSNLEQNKEADENKVSKQHPVQSTKPEQAEEIGAAEEFVQEENVVSKKKKTEAASDDDDEKEKDDGSASEETIAEDEGDKNESDEEAYSEKKDEKVVGDTSSESDDDTVATTEDKTENPENISSEDDSTAFYKEIAEKAAALADQNDWSFIASEFALLAQNMEEGPDPSTDEGRKYLNEFQKIRADFEARRKAHYEELNKKKQENLLKKKELLKSLSDIVNEEKWSAVKEVSQIKSKWENIKQLPQGEAEALNERFNALLEEFESHKVDILVKKLQKEEENLELKWLVLDKMDALNEKLKEEGADFEKLNEQFEDLLAQWRKIGRVPAEKNQELWEHYHASHDAFNELRFKYDTDYRKSIEKALSKKKKLIKEAEALVDYEDLAEAARKVNKLHKAWKKAGNLPQKDENEMWDQFKAATDAFNEKKSENIDQLREQEEENLKEKQKIIDKAEEVKNTDDFDAGHQIMQDLMKKWKHVGPVPRKKSSKIWKKFKGAMDEFYERRRESFKEQRQDQKQNLAKKQEILEKLEELSKHEDPALAVEEAKKLQQEFKDIGHVPIKMKNRIWKQYREVCDVIYGRFRSLGEDLGMEKKLAKAGVEPGSRKQIIKNQKEASKLKKEISVLESEIIQYQEAKTYFKPTNKGNKLLDELQEKIEKAETKLEQKRDRLYELENNIDTLTESDSKSGS